MRSDTLQPKHQCSSFQLELALQDLRNWHLVVSRADNVTLLNLIFLEVTDLELHIVTSTSVWHLLLLVVDNIENLAREVVW